jgi:hypothetical protein
MATVAYTRVQPAAGEDIPTGVAIYEWNLAGATDDGVPVMAPMHSGKVVQRVSGTGTVTWQGSLHLKSETATWGNLHEVNGSTDISLGDAEPKQVLEDCVQIRPQNATAASVVRLMVITPARR